MSHRLVWHTSQADAVVVRAHRQRRLYYASKRLLDVVLAGALLLLLLPVMGVIALLIVLDSPGPAIYRQKRVGLRRSRRNGVETWTVGTFRMYKFRTMYQDNDSSAHQDFVKAFIGNDKDRMATLQGQPTETRKLVCDTRITPVGRFLRKSSLDELPQFWNVLRGDMSLVGPRPPIPYEVDMYEPWHYQRLAVQTGVTGLWQVTARSSAEFDEMVRLDLDYIRNQSLWLDLKILLKTPLAVLRGNGAQ
jgi:lipopolysaccharide/colanic/teichoic acid biosynthesis glycosyltransferase